MFLNRNTNRSASAVTLKNSSKTALIGSILNKGAYYNGNGRISKGGNTDSEVTGAAQGKAFISPEELTDILQQNTPAGAPYPPLPPTPPQAPFPWKAYFSPISRPSINIEYYFNSPSSSNILSATNLSLSFSYPYPIYASTYGIVLSDNITNYTASTDYQNMYVNIPNISATESYTITLYGSNNYGSGKVSFLNFYDNQPRMPFSEGYTASNGINEIIYTFPSIQGTEYYLYQTYNSLQEPYDASYYSYLSNDSIYLLVSGLQSNNTYKTVISASNSLGLITKTLISITNYLEYNTQDILGYARYLNNTIITNTVPTYNINNLSINGEIQYSFEYSKRIGATTYNNNNILQFFTTTADTRSSWVIIDGNFTVNTAQLFRPPVRKLFTVLYVKGNLINNGIITMSARGANHSNLEPHDIYIGNSNRLDTLSNIYIPAIGGNGGAGFTGPVSGFNFRNGSNGTNGGTGGGSTGNVLSNNFNFEMGSGAAGTAYSGGAASGGILNYSNVMISTQPASSNGGKGSDGARNGTGPGIAGGGAGNPIGLNTDGGIILSGTGGTLIIIVEGQISGNGSFTSDGEGVLAVTARGGASGAGSVTVLYNSLAPSFSFNSSVLGGNSGRGGNGSFRVFPLGENSIL
jgi:hypothetical protein